MIGVRVREQPLQAGMAIVNGFAGEHPERRVEAAARAPYPLAGDLALNGVWLSDQPSAVSELVQRYDFATAELTSAFRYEAAGISATVSVTTFASRTAPSIVLQDVEVRTSAPCNLSLRALVETSGLRGRMARRRTATPGEPEPACDGSLLWEAEGGLSTCGVALTTEMLNGADEAPKVQAWDATGPLRSEYVVRTRTDRPVRLRQIVAMVPSVVHDRPDEEAVRRVARAKASGFENLRARNREAWAELWKGRIVVAGASARASGPDRRRASSISTARPTPASPSATSIFGLATWHDYHYYYGHVMWDVDAFCIPPLLFSQPEAARAMLAFRSRGLSAARSNARLSGRKGLQFPWEAAPLSGQEAAPGAGDSAAHEDHGSLAYGARVRALRRRDRRSAPSSMKHAWPVLSGVADWIVSRATRTDRGLEIKRSTGPAEVPEPPDNDAFTIMAARQVLRRAVRAGRPDRAVTAPPEWAEAEQAPLPASRDPTGSSPRMTGSGSRSPRARRLRRWRASSPTTIRPRSMSARRRWSSI